MNPSEIERQDQMSRINTMASDVSTLLNGAGYRGVGFDPASIIAIITTLIQMFQNCGRSSQQAHQCCVDPNVFDLFMLNRVIRDKTGKRTRDVLAISNAVQQVGSTLTPDTVQAMYSEVSS